MPDAVFEHPRLVAIYDDLDPDRSDLDAYLGIAAEVGARSVLDVGCGTGCLALLLADRGIEVVGLDPAAGSLAVARGKPGADRVRWILGDARALPPLQVDLVTITGNAAQAIVADEDWYDTLAAVRAALRPGGRFVFESRVPEVQAWRGWTRERSESVTVIDGVGAVRSWFDVTDVSLPLITFHSVNVFASDGAVITSDSTLRFRSRGELEHDLRQHGFVVEEVRDAPDRPGLELVFVAHRPDDDPTPAVRGVDERGVIIPDGSLDRIDRRFLPVIEATMAAVGEQYGTRLHSLHLYGSVPRGSAVVGESDLDVQAVLLDEPTAADRDRTAALARELGDQHPEISEIGVLVTSLAELTDPANRNDGGFQLGVLCTRWSGSAIETVDYRPTLMLARSVQGDLASALALLGDRLAAASTELERRAAVRSTGRRLLRVAFTLVLARWAGWTSDPETMITAASRWYPERDDDLRTAAALGWTPSTDVPTALALLDRLAPWLLAEHASL